MGSHYGVKIRKNLESVLIQQRAHYECPACHKKSVKRTGHMRWKCSSCGYEFAGGSYTPTTTVGATARKALETVKKTK